MDTKAALDKLFKEGSVTLRDGREVLVYRVSIRTLGRALELLAKVVADLKMDITQGIDTDAFGGDPAAVLKLISKHYDDVVAVVADHCALSLDEVKQLEADDGVKLAQAVYLLNQDFFTKNVLPAMSLVSASREVATAS